MNDDIIFELSRFSNERDINETGSVDGLGDSWAGVVFLSSFIISIKDLGFIIINSEYKSQLSFTK